MKTISLEETCRFFNGYAFKSKDYVSKGIRIIRIANVQKGYIEDKLPCYYPYDSKVASDYALARGDLLISLTGNVGRVGLMPDNLLPAALNQRVACLRVKDDSPLTREFIYAMLNSDQFEQKAIESSNGVAQKNLSASWLKKYQLPLITKGEQTSFCKRFSIIDSNLSKCRTTASKLDSLIKSRFVEMFGAYSLYPQFTSWTKIKELGTVYGGATPKTKDERCWNGEFRWITPAELDNETVYISETARTITGEGVASASLTPLPKGTVLLSSRAPIGKVAITNVEMYCNQGFKNIVCGSRLNPRYLYSLLRFNTDFLNSLGRGATFKEISKRVVENIMIPVPQIDLQEEFERFSLQVDKLRFETQQQIEKLETLKKSLMQEYFG